MNENDPLARLITPVTLWALKIVARNMPFGQCASRRVNFDPAVAHSQVLISPGPFESASKIRSRSLSALSTAVSVAIV